MISLTKPIFLSGAMGTGKSTVGRRLARRLCLPFVDLDHYIEKRAQLSINDIFSTQGEAAFRKLESECLRDLTRGRPCVISLGGGAILSFLNRQILNQGLWINLNVHPAIIFRRVASKKHRPLLGKKVERSTVEEILRKRQPLYGLAPFQLETNGMVPEALAGVIIRKILRGSL